MKVQALFLTILVGIFFLVGILILKFFTNKNKMILITTGLAFVIMLALIILDLAPEIIELIEEINQIFIVILFILIGIAILKMLDLFVPEHHHDHHETKDDIHEHNAHLFHIGLITSISLIIHNILEGISIYITGITDLKMGFIMALTVGCHNIPLGLEIAIGLNSKKEEKISKNIVLFLLVISSFLGAFILFILDNNLNELFELILLSLTLGMILYISLFELFPEIKTNIKKKELKIGIVSGIVLSTILFLI